MTSNGEKHLSFPFRIGSDGRTAQVKNIEDNIRDELVQLLLTNPGERYFLPDFGAGVRQLIFSNLDDFTLAKAKAILTNALSIWLKDRIEIQDITLDIINEEVRVEIHYTIIGLEESKTFIYEIIET
jgi:hypothetical protein